MAMPGPVRPQSPTLKRPVRLGLCQPIPFPLGETAPLQDQNISTLVLSATHPCLGLEAAFSNARPPNPCFWDTLTPQPVLGGEWRMRNVRARGRQPGRYSVSNLPGLSLFLLN